METEKAEQPKTRQQEKAYHMLFSNIANHCVAHGIDVKTVTDRLDRYEVSVTPQFVKGTWKAILTSLTGKTSTTEMTKEEVKQVQEEFGKFWSELTGETFDWPNINDLLHAQLAERL